MCAIINGENNVIYVVSTHIYFSISVMLVKKKEHAAFVPLKLKNTFMHEYIIPVCNVELQFSSIG
jgi:hypothetical protein